MKKQIIVITVVLIIMIVGFCGCFKDSEKDSNLISNDNRTMNPKIGYEKFIGFWTGGITNCTCIVNVTFYENYTAYFSINYFNNSWKWNDISFNNSKICFTPINKNDSTTTRCLWYEFSNNNSSLILSNIYFLTKQDTKLEKDKLIGKWSRRINNTDFVEYHNFTFYSNNSFKEEIVNISGSWINFGTFDIIKVGCIYLNDSFWIKENYFWIKEFNSSECYGYSYWGPDLMLSCPLCAGIYPYHRIG